MKTRTLHRLLAVLLVGLFSAPALAQFSRDSSANQKIDEAINHNYLMMQLDKAESLLTGTVAACEDKCSPETKAKAWMYVGIVRGSGKNDQAGAAQAFATAKGFDPSVQLDSALATPETKETFDSTAGGSAPADAPQSNFEEPAAAASPGEAPGALPPPAGIPGDMLCSPQGAPIGTNMPIPISCSTNANATEGFVKFQEPGSSDWKKISLQDFNGLWQAEIPCKFTAGAGQLKFYIGVKDSSGEYVDQFGSKTSPASLLLSDDGVAPAFPGQPQVTRCGGGGGGDADCPPDFPGCESSSDTAQCGDLDWGASCKNSTQCKCGLLCESGQCATAPSCNVDEECETGACVDGLCSALRNSGGGAGDFKRHWFSLTPGMDLMFIGGEDLCSAERRGNYYTYCYGREGATDGKSVEVSGVNVGTGFAPGQLRIKLGYDYALTEHIRLGLRATAAFLNTHPAESGVPKFFMPHIEARGTYTFTSLADEGLRPSLYLAGGFAGADGKLVTEQTEIYKFAGNQFVSVGGVVAYYFAPNTGVGLDVQFMIPLPQIATILHPALSFTQGF